MTSREELISLVNHISDEHIAKLLETARAMARMQKRSRRTAPTVTEKSLCAEDVCRMSDKDARDVWLYANSRHIE